MKKLLVISLLIVSQGQSILALDDIVEVEGEVIVPEDDGTKAEKHLSSDNSREMMDLETEEASPTNSSLPPPGYAGADQGNWTVDSCIIIKMAAQLTIKPEKNNENRTLVSEVPVSAVVSDTSSCTASNSTQFVALQWTEGGFNRNLSLTFSRNSSTQQYGVSKISAVYELKRINVTVPKVVNETTINVTESVLEYITITTFQMDPWEFLVPENRSYLCVDVGDKSMRAELHRTDETGGSPGERLSNATISFKKVQFDAFRSPDSAPDFQTPSDCSYRPNDIVPIIVGCSLAGLVLMVLVAYLIGRRKSRARGYQSV